MSNAVAACEATSSAPQARSAHTVRSLSAEQRDPVAAARTSRCRRPQPGAIALRSTGSLCEERGRSGQMPVVWLSGGRQHVQPRNPTSRIERRRAISRRRARVVRVACGLLRSRSRDELSLVGTVQAAPTDLERRRESSTAHGGEHGSSVKRRASYPNPANVAALARRDYDMVRPGQKAYTVLPLSGGSSQSSAASSKGTVHSTRAPWPQVQLSPRRSWVTTA